MKKSILFIAAMVACLAAFAQRTAGVRSVAVNPVSAPHTSALGRTTAAGDTISLSNISGSLTAYTYGSDGGYVAGTDKFNDLAFAERYDFNGADSSLNILGVITRFTGAVNPASANTVSFHVWDVSVQKTITASLAYSGLPNNVIDTLTVPFTQLGIGVGADTQKTFYFDSATIAFNQSFFVGYSINYSFAALAGDTIGLMSSFDGARTTPHYSSFMYVNDFGDTTRDTVINVQNATQWSDYTWHDNYTDNDSIFNDLAIYPIVAINAPTAVQGITRHDLTVFGAYPNPAVNSTNIRFSLAKNADVTIQLMDMTGRVLQSADHRSLAQGEHIIPVQTTELTAGNYLYFIRTSAGDGMAGQLSIVK